VSGPLSIVDAEVVVVGAGAAGLYAALTAARAGARVALVSATPLAQTASYWAQGGLAAALDPADSPDQHRHDTEVAGRGAVRRSAAALLCREAPRAVRELEELGVAFDRDGTGGLALGLEGGHSRRGVVLEDGRAVRARATILATGGAAALWARTTNPPGSLGIGMLLAHAAGAALADLEFVQFHPTAVTGIAGREGFLVTEAIRGEGATLLDAGHERFVEELKPRDEVSLAVYRTMVAQDTKNVWLDMRHVDPLLFPNIVGALRESGLDPATELVPVSPAAHFCMGGVVADLDGASSVPGLYVVGETACTGLHGANRLASNSLTECFVQGKRAALAGLDEPRLPVAPADPPPAAPIQPPSRATREALWRHAGLTRDAEGLALLRDDPHPLARIVAACGMLRTESRGAHVRSDFPATDPALDGHHAVVGDDDLPAFESWT
jgi:L-aspartate oxidase